MAITHLQGKRTGRPRGSKSSSPLKRDLRWAYRNLGKDVEPPTDGARYWAKMAREEPEKFVAAMTALDEASRRSSDAAQDGNAATLAGQNLMTISCPAEDLGQGTAHAGQKLKKTRLTAQDFVDYIDALPAARP